MFSSKVGLQSPIIYKINQPEFRDKMVGFDYDWTLVHPRDGKTFPTSIDDWVWMYSNIPTKLVEYYADGYMIVIFTNQSKSWKCEQIEMVMKLLQIPLFVVIAREKSDYKPNPILFDSLFCDYQINKKESFYVGDALGRKCDFSDSDRVFADNLGIKCYSPEEIFRGSEVTFQIPKITLSNNPEIIIMVGYPGSGKTTIAKDICQNNNYIHIQGDLYKTSSKMLKASLEEISKLKSIVFDATNSSIKKRNEFIQLANKYSYEVKCIHATASLEESYKRNKSRNEEKQVPKIAYSVYKKYYQQPSETEGFTLHQV
tara:strand:- start:43 stop:984 length:942 start_codon:yes stop_codon:yes gene_type:complete